MQQMNVIYHYLFIKYYDYTKGLFHFILIYWTGSTVFFKDFFLQLIGNHQFQADQHG